ncbi:MAG: GNAT family N-acetyltransferase [Gammaproteobacteria bacterium]|nr:GNAT family N-acetyltransferase [Gammaproteobacteria bacterium]
MENTVLENTELRLMQPEDIDTVIAIIEANDEDDAEEAAQSYQNLGLENQFVLTRSEKILGVTGCRFVENAHQTCWLSWTYLDPAEKGQGLGQKMLQDMVDKMRAGDIRKVFVSTSDYEDPEEGPLYAAAHRMYEAAGFRPELTHPDYYEPGEAQIIYGLPLADIPSERQIAPDDSAAFFNGLNEIPETEGIYVINWEVAKKRLLSRQKPQQFTQQDLEIGIERAREWSARSIFIAFPSNMPNVLPPLEAAGFFEEGRLKDYYEDGLDEVHFRFNL